MPYMTSMLSNRPLNYIIEVEDVQEGTTRKWYQGPDLAEAFDCFAKAVRTLAEPNASQTSKHEHHRDSDVYTLELGNFHFTFLSIATTRERVAR